MVYKLMTILYLAKTNMIIKQAMNEDNSITSSASNYFLASSWINTHNNVQNLSLYYTKPTLEQVITNTNN